jgi:Pyruvate/2-oxoacid:ferredoxin oxidoreductase gamma subunit
MKDQSLNERTIIMDTTETTNPSTETLELIALEADEDQADTPGFGTEVAKTLALSTATSALVFGGFAAIAVLAPKVKAWFNARKKDVPATVEEAVDEANAKIDSLKKD